MKWLLLALVARTAAANRTPDDDGDDDDGGAAGPYPYGVILVMCGVVALGFCVGYFLLARVALATRAACAARPSPSSSSAAR